MPTASCGAAGSSSANAEAVSAADVPPTTPIFNSWRRVSDMSGSLPAPVRLRRVVIRGQHLLRRLGRIRLGAFLAALEALRCGPGGSDRRSHNQTSEAGGDVRRMAGAGFYRRIGRRGSEVVHRRLLEHRNLEGNFFFRAAYAGSANADRPYIRHFVEVPG